LLNVSAIVTLGFQPLHILLALIGHLPQDARRSLICGRGGQSAALLDPSSHALKWVELAHASRFSSPLSGAIASFEFAASLVP
jgi:hypothetical protein